MAKETDTKTEVNQPVLRWSSIRNAGRGAATLVPSSDGRVFYLPYAPADGHELRLPAKTSYSLPTGVSVVVPAGYVAHVAALGSAGELLPSFSLAPGPTREIVVRTHNPGPGELRYQAGNPCAALWLARLPSVGLAQD